MKKLTLSLKKQWFDMIKSGQKKEEYREIKDHYLHAFLRVNDLENYFHHDLPAHLFANRQIINIGGFYKHFDRLVFTLGYPKADDTERRLYFKNPKIRIGTGRPEWGAEPGKNYFVITWGE